MSQKINSSQKSTFRQESLDYARSPEQLDDYIKASRPGSWVVLLALTVFMVTAIVFGITGTLPETLEVRGFTGEDGQIHCFLPSDSDYLHLEGCPISGSLPDGTIVTGYVKSVSGQPYSRQELRETLHSDWIAENLLCAMYSYELVIHTDEQFETEQMASVVITVDEVKPITFIIN